MSPNKKIKKQVIELCNVNLVKGPKQSGISTYLETIYKGSANSSNQNATLIKFLPGNKVRIKSNLFLVEEGDYSIMALINAMFTPLWGVARKQVVNRLRRLIKGESTVKYFAFTPEIVPENAANLRNRGRHILDATNLSLDLKTEEEQQLALLLVIMQHAYENNFLFVGLQHVILVDDCDKLVNSNLFNPLWNLLKEHNTLCKDLFVLKGAQEDIDLSITNSLLLDTTPYGVITLGLTPSGERHYTNKVEQYHGVESETA